MRSSTLAPGPGTITRGDANLLLKLDLVNDALQGLCQVTQAAAVLWDGLPAALQQVAPLWLAVGGDQRSPGRHQPCTSNTEHNELPLLSIWGRALQRSTTSNCANNPAWAYASPSLLGYTSINSLTEGPPHISPKPPRTITMVHTAGYRVSARLQVGHASLRRAH